MSLKDRYKEYSDNKIIEIIIQKDNYQKEAVDIALEIIKERNLDKELDKVLQKNEIENEKLEQAKFEQYEKVKDINLSNRINVKIADVAKFEGELVKQNINFYREDKNIGGGLELYPSQNYFFSDEDFLNADKACVNLGLTDAYQDIKPYFRFELKILLIVAALIIVALLILL